MGNKKKEAKKSTEGKDSSRIDERAKEAMGIKLPDENPFFMENEAKLNRFRYAWKTDRMSRKEKNNRHNRGYL